MKYKISIIYILFLFVSLGATAQEKQPNMYDSAHVYLAKKDFKRASYFFDIYYIDQKNTQSNYDTYFAAVAAAHVGNMERASYYLKQSALIGYDVDNYHFFAEDPDNLPLRDLPEWKNFIGTFKIKADSARVAMAKVIAGINDSSVRASPSLLSNETYWKDLAKRKTAGELIRSIKAFNTFSPTKKDNFWTLYQIKANDTLTVPFLVHIPKGYDPAKKAPLYVYLHGAVVNRANFTKPEYIPDATETKVMSVAMARNAFIMYPLAKKDFGWLYQQEAFETVIKEIRQVKSLYNIDDERVYIGGHSNGGSGAFWFALNQPSAFAGFFGLNYLPKAYFGNTAFNNLSNAAPFYGVSGSEDTTFPLPTVNSIYQTGVKNNLNWKNFVRKGTHILPFTSPDSINFVFDMLAAKTRDPFPKQVRWETDNVKNGRYAWVEILELDTSANPASWHHNEPVEVVQGGKTMSANFNPRKSGAVAATAEGNTIKIETSCVKRIRLYISPDMFNLTKQIKIIVNGKQYLNFKAELDKQVIVEEFLKTKDRGFIVGNKVEFTVN